MFWHYLERFHFPTVPDDVFAPDFIWKGSYDYKGQKQPMTLTVTSFNATTGKVNVTLRDSSMEFLLSGESSINHLSSTSSPLTTPQQICVSLPFILRMPHVNQSITKWSHAWEWKLTIGAKDGCYQSAASDWLTAHSRVTRLLPSSPSCFFFSHLFFSSPAFLHFPRSLLSAFIIPPHSLPHLFTRIISLLVLTL